MSHDVSVFLIFRYGVEGKHSSINVIFFLHGKDRTLYLILSVRYFAVKKKKKENKISVNNFCLVTRMDRRGLWDRGLDIVRQDPMNFAAESKGFCNRPLSNCERTKEQRRGCLYKGNCKVDLSGSTLLFCFSKIRRWSITKTPYFKMATI